MSEPEYCAKCGKQLWVYMWRQNFPWEYPKREKWCFRCALGGLKLFDEQGNWRDEPLS